MMVRKGSLIPEVVAAIPGYENRFPPRKGIFMEASNEKIVICMLGRFSISQGELSIGDSYNRTHQLWNLLEYLIAYRSKTVSQEELISVLWPDESSENPANALKNLIYRIRTTFSGYGFEFARDMILFHRGSYHWNNELDCVVDVEEFDRLIAEGFASADREIKIDRFMRAIALYEGDFLPGSNCEEWVVSLSACYRSKYFSCVFETLEMLMARGQYEEARKIAEKAIVVDPFEEHAHMYLIRTLVFQDKPGQALEHYRRITDLFYRELGVRPSEALRSLYREITKSVKNVESDLDMIREDLAEQNAPMGAYYCDYEVFKNMYRVEARAASRSGEAIFVGLLTVTDTDNNIPELRLLSRVMEHLLECIRLSLRRGDVVSRFSPTQYVLMLPTLTYENGEMVLERICRRFRQDFRNREIRIHTNLQPLQPVDA